MFTYFLVCEGLSTDDVGVARGTVFREIRPWAGFKTDDFVKEKLGGYRRTTPKKCNSYHVMNAIVNCSAGSNMQRTCTTPPLAHRVGARMWLSSNSLAESLGARARSRYIAL